VSYLTDGWLLWVASGLSFCASAASVPAMQGYSTELFPTRARGRVGGLLSAVTVAGSATGLVLAGQLSVRWDSLGQAVAVLAIAPMLVAILVVVGFPETAQRELEDFNPDDPRMDPSPTATEPVADTGSLADTRPVADTDTRSGP
jgi:MFS family permease